MWTPDSTRVSVFRPWGQGAGLGARPDGPQCHGNGATPRGTRGDALKRKKKQRIVLLITKTSGKDLKQYLVLF